MNAAERAELERDHDRLVLRFLETDNGEDLQLIALMELVLGMTDEEEKAA
jgi:hypothetical protein